MKDDATQPGNYFGFEIYLLHEIPNSAKQDGYNLHFELSLSPQRYTNTLDLVANNCNTTSNPPPHSKNASGLI